MGSFSWLKADEGGQVENVYGGGSFKFLIPKEFGGGFIKDKYQDYGYLGTKENGDPKHDMYEILAFWNTDRVSYDTNEKPNMKEIDRLTDRNRSIGIEIGCYDRDMESLKYPLKLVSPRYKGTYEDCKGYSKGDPNQGWGKSYRKRKIKQ